ncbi:hypothetical protein D6C84_02671 [Aureobasidium pullulans]|uniref:ATP12-domain-containing protein n=1 Tax=Aureobasidium pullulans TaxID=5580 RepID=A0A4V4JI71_AURPU|nr:hypothetical protein D6D06_06626 [Aureobasidium pullulans]THX77752.1 hypothetical protein D6D05_05672 [Aureobasidium pullulans]THZ86152.1 hypothetical protein D6C84_02671 [Aureobasidium pullulans]
MEAIIRPALTASGRRTVTTRFRPACRCLHNSASRTATPLPHGIAAGPPPQPPQAPTTETEERVARKRQQAALLERQAQIKVDPKKPATALRKRFWKESSVVETPDGLQIMLDKRPVRTASKEILTLPPTKHALASGIALEWDLLTSAQQALKHHYIPLTSLSSRAVDMHNADLAGDKKIRDSVVTMLMRYLSTDTLLCWDPEKSIHDPSSSLDMKDDGQPKQSLRSKQVENAEPILAYLTTHIFPGLEIVPILGEESIMPVPQPKVTQEVIRGWMTALPAFELAGLERGVLATKSLLVAIRLLVEWSQEFRHLQKTNSGSRFGIPEARAAASVEVTWQTDMWGEVEDTHDVDKEDVARQLGSVILLVS